MLKFIKISFISGLLITSNIAMADTNDLASDIQEIQTQWAINKYTAPNKDAKIAGYEDCATNAQNLANNFPERAEPIIWQGICLASEAELVKLSALAKVKEAKQLFEKALSIDPNALEGSSYTNLGVLYQRVPGWPIGFGDDDKAVDNFKKALVIAPNNIDANYFYAIYLKENGQKAEAIHYLQKALNAPTRNRPLADKERKKEIIFAIKELNK